MTYNMDVYKNECPEWSSLYQRYVMRSYWNVSVKGKLFTGFGTKAEAIAYGQNQLA